MLERRFSTARLAKPALSIWAFEPAPRPTRTAAGTVEIVLRLAREYPTRSYRRIHGELAPMDIRSRPQA